MSPDTMPSATMPAASIVPAPPLAPTPTSPPAAVAPSLRPPSYIFFSDFDGTITRTDSNHQLVDVHGSGREARLQTDADIMAGRLEFRSAWHDLLASVSRVMGIRACCDWLRGIVELDAHFEPFYRWSKENGMDLLVISGGMRVVIEDLLEAMLGQEVRQDLRVLGNDAGLVPGCESMDVAGGWEILWRDETPYGHDKSLEIRKYSRLPPEQRPIMFYAGDGISDFMAARETNLLFAKTGRELVAYCEENKIPHIRFDDFSIIMQVVQEIVGGDMTVQEALAKYGTSYE